MGRGDLAVLPACLVLTGAAFAQDAGLPPAPDWFVAAVVSTTTAQRIAQICPDLSLDPPQVEVLSQATLDRLEAEGFDLAAPSAGMAPSEDAFAAAQESFVAKHGLTGEITADLVCAAGRAEMAEGSDLGRLLIEVPQ